MDDWIHVEKSPWLANVVYVHDSKNQVSEWMHEPSSGLTKTKNLGSALPGTALLSLLVEIWRTLNLLFCFV